MAADRPVFRLHAIQRMFERRINVDEVRQIVLGGEAVREYPDDTPYPSRLVLGWIGTRPIHVVMATNVAGGETIVVTVHEPDPAQWKADFKRKRP